jgi:hypothetical protein
MVAAGDACLALLDRSLKLKSEQCLQLAADVLAGAVGWSA